MIYDFGLFSWVNLVPGDAGKIQVTTRSKYNNTSVLSHMTRRQLKGTGHRRQAYDLPVGDAPSAGRHPGWSRNCAGVSGLEVGQDQIHGRYGRYFIDVNFKTPSPALFC